MSDRIISNQELIYGKDFNLTPHITIHNPTLKEIIDFGEEKYFKLVVTATNELQDWSYIIKCCGMDYNVLTDFLMFHHGMKSFTTKDTGILFGELDFTKFRLYTDSSNGDHILYDSENGIIIDENIYRCIAENIRIMNGLKKKIKPIIDEDAQQELITLKNLRVATGDDEEFKPILQPIVEKADGFAELKISTFTCLEPAV